MEIPAEYVTRLQECPFFFIATSDASGKCDCSFKGGGAGFLRILSQTEIAFPDYDGNGAFMTLGNILENPQVGMLFIDFSDGGRMRVNGRASIRDDDPFPFTDAVRVVHVQIEEVILNCARFIPKMTIGDAS